jgi:hypothetical protein
MNSMMYESCNVSRELQISQEVQNQSLNPAMCPENYHIFKLLIMTISFVYESSNA